MGWTFTAPFTVVRLLTSLRMTYEAAKKRAPPSDKIVGWDRGSQYRVRRSNGFWRGQAGL
jgi:hypothetical protein